MREKEKDAIVDQVIKLGSQRTVMQEELRTAEFAADRIVLRKKIKEIDAKIAAAAEAFRGKGKRRDWGREEDEGTDSVAPGFPDLDPIRMKEEE